MTLRGRICIVSSGCLSTGPRVVKEADALASAGYAVHVVVCHWMNGQAEWDARIARDRPWTWSALRRAGWRGRLLPSAITGRVLRTLGRRVSAAVGPLAPVDEMARSDLTWPLTRLAARAPADLFIGHNLAALPAAAALARRTSARLAFDVEDDHFGELPPDEQQSLEGRLRDVLLTRYLSRCDLVTASSDGIADALSARYGIARPTVVHNAFPWALRGSLDGAIRDRVGPGPSLYWYSQTVGLDRGIQDAIRAMPRMPETTELHLRGKVSNEVREALQALAYEVGVQSRMHIHPPVHPDELLSRTAEHDVGLTLDQPVSDNRLQAVPNKLFYYLLAGLAVAASDTPGQRRVMKDLPGTGVSYAPGDHAELGQRLGSLLADIGSLSRAKEASLVAAEQRWNWEKEQRRLVDAVERTWAG